MHFQFYPGVSYNGRHKNHRVKCGKLGVKWKKVGKLSKVQKGRISGGNVQEAMEFRVKMQETRKLEVICKKLGNLEVNCRRRGNRGVMCRCWEI